MSLTRLLFIAVVISILTLPIVVFALENYGQQMATIISLYEILSGKKSPTVSDFFRIFGKGNEAELQLILRKRFPSLDWKGNWFANQEAANYINNVYSDPIQYPSLFLQCIKTAEPELFAVEFHGQIEFPPKVTKDFTTFSVTLGRKKILFEFSQNESKIENIYLPDRQSIYTLIERCIK